MNQFGSHQNYENPEYRVTKRNDAFPLQGHSEARRGEKVCPRSAAGALQLLENSAPGLS